MVEAGDIITLTAGAWRLLAPLGGASYGRVWRAESVLDGTPAAVKLVNRARMDLALPPQRAVWRACFDAEIAFLRGLQAWDRRHIVRLLDSGEHDGLPAMALELLDGDLAAHLAASRSRGDGPGVDRALAWTAQVNGALAKVHQYGWRYLDLKPANLLVDARGSILKLADFGTNRPLTDSAAHSYAGTAAWQAPEQFFPDDAGRYRTDARSDYFALGALLYYLVTGIPLRFCAACADAYRTHGTAGAAALRAAAAPPAILAPDETALFLAHASARDHAALLVLLRALLAPRPEARPRHALEISRLVARAAAGLDRAPIAMRSAA
jgi:eukaryotic-like serine/threonine-protein kinase